MSREVDAWLPTLERARAEGLALPAQDPTESLRMAALIVVAHSVTRERWCEQTVLSSAVAATAQRGEPPPPTGAKLVETHVRLAELLETRECSMCAARRRRSASKPRRPEVRCDACGTTGEVSRVRLDHFTDTVRSMRETYVASSVGRVGAMLAFEPALEELTAAEPPECLACHDLAPRTGGTAYRGGSRERTLDFEGHLFGDAVDLARAGVERFLRKGRAVRVLIRAWAWPFVWLRYGAGGDSRRELALLVGADRRLHLFVGGDPEPD